MSTQNTDAHNLFEVQYQGLIREDVMDQIWDLSDIPLPFTDMIGRHQMSNHYTEWTLDELPAPDITNAAIDGADVDRDDSVLGDRVGNHSQLMDKMVKVSTRARDVNTIGFADTLPYQVMRRQQALRRDFEAIMLTSQASVRGTDTVEGRMGGLGAWLETNTDRGATGADGGFNLSTGLVDAPTNGTQRALSFATTKDIANQVYRQGGMPTVLMSMAEVIEQLSEFMYSGNAAIATLQRDRGEQGPAQAQASVNVLISDHGIVLRFVSNRLQQPVTSSPNRANVFIIDPAWLAQGILGGYTVEELGKSGHSDKRLMKVDGSLVVNSEKAHGLIADIDWALPAVA